MSYISSYKSSPFALFKTYTGTALGTTPDSSYNTICGARFEVEGDGREVALVSVGTTAITQGVLCQAPAEVTAFQKLAMTVPTAYPATAGSTQILVTNGATVLNQNQFIGGYAIVASGTGIGQTLKIQSHQNAAASGTFVVTLEDPILVTLDATSKISLVYNPYTNIIITPATTATGAPVGATLYALTASTAGTYSGTTGAQTAAPVPSYGFVVVKGPTGILVDNSVTNVGYPVGASKVTAGTVGVATLTSTPMVGISAQTLTSANVGLILLNL